MQRERDLTADRHPPRAAAYLLTAPKETSATLLCWTARVDGDARGGQRQTEGSRSDPSIRWQFTNPPMPILEPGRRRRRQRPSATHMLWLLALGLAVAIAVQAVLR